MGNTLSITLLEVAGGIAVYIMISVVLLAYWISLVTIGDWLWERKQYRLEKKMLADIEEFRNDFD